MIQTKWLVFFIMAFMICSIFSGFIEQSYVSSNGGSSVLTPLFEMWTTSSSGLAGKVWMLATSSELYNSFWHMFCWDYAMYTGIYTIVKIPLLVISAGMAFSIFITLVMSVGPLVTSAISALLGR